MQSAAHLGLGELLPTRAALLTAAAVWTTGFALAGASALHMHHANAAAYAGAEPPGWTEAASSEQPADTAEAEGVVTMPMDVIIGRTTPITGVVSMQKP